MKVRRLYRWVNSPFQADHIHSERNVFNCSSHPFQTAAYQLSAETPRFLPEEILVVSALISREALSCQRFEKKKKLTGVIVLYLMLAPHLSEGDKASGSWHAHALPLRVPSKALPVSTFRPRHSPTCVGRAAWVRTIAVWKLCHPRRFMSLAPRWWQQCPCRLCMAADWR